MCYCFFLLDGFFEGFEYEDVDVFDVFGGFCFIDRVIFGSLGGFGLVVVYGFEGYVCGEVGVFGIVFDDGVG